MDISGLVSYDSNRGPMSTATSSRGMMMPHLDITMPSYTQTPIENFVFPAQNYNYNQMPPTSYHQPMVPTSYYSQSTPTQHSPHHSGQHVYHSSPTSSQGLPHVREALNAVSSATTSPIVKQEDQNEYRSYGGQYEHPGNVSPTDSKASLSTTSGNENQFTTGIDNLMKAIQSKSQSSNQRRLPPPPSQPIRSSATGPSQAYHGYPNMTEPLPYMDQPVREKSPKAKKRYMCEIPGCTKAFYQKTHLEIHTRAHTGAKPFECKEPGCGQKFSQLGNLKTHERRHTGERPYGCDKCGKRFAQRGNVRAHRIVHETAKPFVCKLEDCQKQFTQLGNLKSHQNKFHASTLQDLTLRFANIHEGDSVSSADKELWEYFATLYKNSNKGIKGRGKDRKISTSTSSSTAGAGVGSQQPTSSTSGVAQMHSGEEDEDEDVGVHDEMDHDQHHHHHQHHHQQQHPHHQHHQQRRDYGLPMAVGAPAAAPPPPPPQMPQQAAYAAYEHPAAPQHHLQGLDRRMY